MNGNELRKRLKHIAALLLGISCDIGTEQDQVAELTATVERLESELEYRKHPTKKTEEQCAKHAERMREYQAKKRSAEPSKERAPKPKRTVEEKRAANKLAVIKYQAKKRAERQAAASAQKSAQTP